MTHLRKSFERKPFEAEHGDTLLVTDTGQWFYRDGRRWIASLNPYALPSVRAILAANVPVRVTFPGTHSAIPDFRIRCFAIKDDVINFNDEIHTYTVSSVDAQGFDIVSDTECSMTLKVSKVDGDGITSIYVAEIP